MLSFHRIRYAMRVCVVRHIYSPTDSFCGRRSKLCANILHIKIKHNQTFECQSSQQLKIEFKLFKIFVAASCWLLAFVCVISIDIVLWNTEPDTMNRSLYETHIRDGSELSKNTWLANLQFHDERRVVYDVMLLCSLFVYSHWYIYAWNTEKNTQLTSECRWVLVALFEIKSLYHFNRNNRRMSKPILYQIFMSPPVRTIHLVAREIGLELELRCVVNAKVAARYKHKNILKSLIYFVCVL